MIPATSTPAERSSIPNRCIALLLTSVLLAGLVASIVQVHPALAQSEPTAGVYVPLTGSRVFDTRAGGGGVIAAQTWRDVQLTGQGGIPTAGVVAVVVDLTVLNNASDGWGLLWQAGAPQPLTSSINYVPGRVVTNAVTTKVSTDGKARFYSWVATDMLVDVVGYYRASPGAGYVPLTQERIMNTADTGMKVGGNTSFYRKLRGVAGIPDSSSVNAVVLNMTVYNQTGGGYITVWPTDVPRPVTSAMNYTYGRAHTQMVVATLSADGRASIYISPNVSTDMILDVVGYYRNGAGDAYIPLTPARIVDTRFGVGPVSQPLAPSTDTAIKVTGLGGVPETGVSTVLLSVVADAAGTASNVGFLTFWASGDPKPAPFSVFSMTYYGGEDTSNLTMAKVGEDGKVIVTNEWATTALILDVIGYFGTPPPPPPVEVLAEAGDGVATVGWVPSDASGAGPVNFYDVTSCPGGVIASPTCQGRQGISVAGDVWDVRFEGLINGEVYTFAVVARSAGRSSEPATSNAVFPRAPMTLGHQNAASAKGATHTLVVNTDGTVSAWGLNGFGQLGDGTTASNPEETAANGLTGVIAVAAGERHSMALKSDGTVWAWGDNSSGQVGRPGPSTTTPVKVADLTGISAIAAGAYHSVALTTTGTVWVWGEGASGQVGRVVNGGIDSPTPVVELSDIKNVAAAGSYSLALHKDGSVWGWGSNSAGQLGFPAGGVITEATRIQELPGALAVAAGDTHAMALSSEGSVSAWGANEWGQAGDASLSPGMFTVPGLSGVSMIAAGARSSVALKGDGTVWSWGANDWGQLGLGYSTNTPNPSPVQMLKTPVDAPTPITGVASITAGRYAVLVVTVEGVTWETGQHFAAPPDRCVLATRKGSAKTTKRRVVVVVPVPDPPPTGRADRQPHRMGAQLQEGILKGHTFGRPINQGTPISKAQLKGKMKQIYDEGPKAPEAKFYPWGNEGKRRLLDSIRSLEMSLDNLVGPICDFRKQFLQKLWNISGYDEFRLDLDNYTGCNLAS